jgi:hypothetical protein
MVVIRFNDEASFRAAYEAVKTDLEALVAEGEKEGYKREEITRLNQVA